MEFVDRIEEQQRLIKTLNSEKPTFVVVYGRPNRTCHQISLLAKEIGLIFPDDTVHNFSGQLLNQY